MKYQETEILGRHQAGHSVKDIATALVIEEAAVELVISKRQATEVLLVAMGSVLSMLKDYGHPAPKSIIQMALQERFPVFQNVTSFMVFIGHMHSEGWVTMTSNKLALTDAGREKALKFDEAIDGLV